jgi:hypothetical protein
MIATLVSFALPFLFAGTGLVALASLAFTWRTYWRELGLLRAQLTASAEWREFDVRVARTQVREFSVPVRRSALRSRPSVSWVMAGPGRRATGKRAAA